MIYFIILYLLGAFACYFLCRAAIFDRNDKHEWQLMTKIAIINISLLSWLSIAMFMVVAILTITRVINPDKNVKW